MQETEPNALIVDCYFDESTNAFKTEIDQCLASGMNDFVTKPYQEETLLNVMVNQIRGIRKKAQYLQQTGSGGRSSGK